MKRTTMKQYVEVRKKGLEELKELLYRRDKITKNIRMVRQELSDWDTYLMNK